MKAPLPSRQIAQLRPPVGAAKDPDRSRQTLDTDHLRHHHPPVRSLSQWQPRRVAPRCTERVRWSDQVRHAPAFVRHRSAGRAAPPSAAAGPGQQVGHSAMRPRGAVAPRFVFAPVEVPSVRPV